MRDFVVLVSLDDAACRAMARKLRAEHVYCRILPSTATADDILRMDARGILLASGATGYAAELPQMMDYLQSGLPMLCMGDAALTLCQTLGGTLLDRAQDSSVVPVTFLQEDPVLSGVEDGERFIPALRYIDMGDMQGSVVARSEEGVLGFRASQRDVWGLAFPLEKHDVGGIQLLTNFCRDVCGCSLWWSNQAFVERAKESISEAAEGGEALCALSGGVDSGVCALLGHQALGERLHCIFVDTGLLRQDEAEQVMDFYGGQMGLKVKRIDASQEFLTALSGVRNPEEKEHIVHTLLRDILLREAAAIEGIRLMIQGTNYSDAPQADDLPENLPQGVRIIEPVLELFKDEIRLVGEELGMHPTQTQRQPFPGSGLASRILTDVTAQRLSVLRRADAIFRTEIIGANLHKRLWQYFAALAESPYPTGGLIVTLRAVQAADGAASMPARLPSDLLERVTLEILSQCPEVERVMYDYTPSKSYAQSEWR